MLKKEPNTLVYGFFFCHIKGSRGIQKPWRDPAHGDGTKKLYKLRCTNHSDEPQNHRHAPDRARAFSPESYVTGTLRIWSRKCWVDIIRFLENGGFLPILTRISCPGGRYTTSGACFFNILRHLVAKLFI